MQIFETTTELMPWQVAAVEKLKPTRVGGLFMEMGTGKSLCAIEIVRQRAHKIDRVVWFCPVSLKDTVRLEILKHTDCGPGDVYQFDDRTTAETLPAPEAARWVIIGIESLSSSNRVTFAARQAITEKTCVILDESSYIKGHRAKRTERAILLAEKCKYRFVLTGTPISQGVEDLFTQMKFLSPKILGYRSWYTFARNHLEYSKHHPGLIVRALDTDQLAAKIAPYVYQVTKAECMDLPGKKHDHRYFKMTKEQQAAYDEAKEELLFQMELEAVNGEVFKPYTLFRLFSVLQQIACGFWNHRITNGWTIDPNDTYEFRTFPDNRLDTMLDLISDTIPTGEKIIIWAKFRYDIRRIVSALRDIYGPDSVAVFTGYTKQRDRQAEVEKFRGPARFFVSTQSCGGHGLTLNEAHHVIFYSNSFKYAERQQAEDRCHRMGQEQEVRYYDILGPGIDDKIWESLSRKENAVDAFRREVEAVKESRAKVKDLVKLL